MATLRRFGRGLREATGDTGTLQFTRIALWGAIGLNALAGVATLWFLWVTYQPDSQISRILSSKLRASGATSHDSLRAMTAFQVGVVVIVAYVLYTLLAIVDSVDEGDPFVQSNAARLRRIAWTIMGLEIVRWVVAAILRGSAVALERPNLGLPFSTAEIVAVLMLFVLARVFEHGAQMRDDLAGTV